MRSLFPCLTELLLRYPIVSDPTSIARKPCALRSSNKSRSSFQNVTNFLGFFSIIVR
jgi:hypothetical protein